MPRLNDSSLLSASIQLLPFARPPCYGPVLQIHFYLLYSMSDVRPAHFPVREPLLPNLILQIGADDLIDQFVSVDFVGFLRAVHLTALESVISKSCILLDPLQTNLKKSQLPQRTSDSFSVFSLPLI